MVQKLSRQQLQQFLPNHEAIKAFEALFNYVYTEGPTANDAAQLAADNAQVQAGEALAQLAAIATALSQVLLSPALEEIKEDVYAPPIDKAEPDEYAPPSPDSIAQDMLLGILEQTAGDQYLPPQSNGTLADQNADRVKISGGFIDGVAAGLNAALTYLRVIRPLAGDVGRFEGDTNDAQLVINQTDVAGATTAVLLLQKAGANQLKISNNGTGTSYYDSLGTTPKHVWRFNGANKIILDATGLAVLSRITGQDATALIASSVTMNNGAAAAAGTLLNAPVAGNPSKWVPINDNGTIRHIPAW